MIRTLGGLLDTGSEWTPIAQDPKRHRGPPGRAAVYGGQVTNGVVGRIYLTVGPVGPQTYLAFTSLVQNAQLEHMYSAAKYVLGIHGLTLFP